MSDFPHRPRSAEEWDVLIEAYLTAGLSQKVFCQQQGISLHTFSHRYQRSPRFQGKRRQKSTKGFASVKLHPNPPAAKEGWVVRFRDQVTVDCPAGTAVDVLIQLARGLADVA